MSWFSDVVFLSPKPGTLFRARRICCGMSDRKEWPRLDELHCAESLGSVRDGLKRIKQDDILLLVRTLKDSWQFIHGEQLVWMWENDMWDKDKTVCDNLEEIKP